jgi:hypothetical protein
MAGLAGESLAMGAHGVTDDAATTEAPGDPRNA